MVTTSSGDFHVLFSDIKRDSDYPTLTYFELFKYRKKQRSMAFGLSLQGSRQRDVFRTLILYDFLVPDALPATTLSFLIWAWDRHQGGPWWLGLATTDGVEFKPAALQIPTQRSITGPAVPQSAVKKDSLKKAAKGD